MNALPLPVNEPIARPRREGYGEDRPDPLEGQITDSWQQVFTALTTTVAQQPVKTTAVNLTGQTATIGATGLGVGATSTGLYRVTYYLSVTSIAGAWALTVTIGWTDNGVAKSLSGAGLSSLSPTILLQSGSLMPKADAATPIAYTVTKGGVGAITYDFSIVLETISI